MNGNHTCQNQFESRRYGVISCIVDPGMGVLDGLSSRGRFETAKTAGVTTIFAGQTAIFSVRVFSGFPNTPIQNMWPWIFGCVSKHATIIASDLE